MRFLKIIAFGFAMLHFSAFAQVDSDATPGGAEVELVDTGPVTVEVDDLIYAYSDTAFWSSRQQKWMTPEEVIRHPLPIGIAIVGSMTGGSIIGATAGWAQGGTNGLLIGGAFGAFGGLFGWTALAGGFGMFVVSTTFGAATAVSGSVLIDMSNGKTPKIGSSK